MGVTKKQVVVLPSTPQKKALLIEDDTLIQHLHQHYLHALDFVVDIAETQVDALSFAFNHTYDLILADLGLADSREESIITNLRENPSRNRKTRLIVVTATHSHCLKERCFKAGADAFLLKPLSFNLLKNTLAKFKTPTLFSVVGGHAQ